MTRIRQRHGVAFLGIAAFVALGVGSTSSAESAPVDTSQFLAAAVGATSTITSAKSSTGRLAQTLPVPSHNPQGGVSLVQVCNPSTIGRGQDTICTVTATNDSFHPATVGATSRVTDGLSIIHADAATISENGRTAVAGPVSLAGKMRATAEINPIDRLDTPDGGYLPLSQFGVDPTAVGDETVVNYDVPEFVFGGRTYDRIGVVSDGYVVLGGDAADISFTPQHLADPARPNGVLAPYWTDLNGEDGLNGGGEGIRVGVLLDDVSGDRWLVVDWDRDLFGDATPAGRRDLQVWIGLNGTEDVTYSYDSNALTGSLPAAGLTVGAENESGTIGAQIAGPPTTSYIVTTTPVVPGQSLSYDLRVQGVHVGGQTLTTRMRSDVVAGATTVATNITVTQRR